jgi:hypothetical protein
MALSPVRAVTWERMMEKLNGLRKEFFDRMNNSIKMYIVGG